MRKHCREQGSSFGLQLFLRVLIHPPDSRTLISRSGWLCRSCWRRIVWQGGLPSWLFRWASGSGFYRRRVVSHAIPAWNHEQDETIRAALRSGNHYKPPMSSASSAPSPPSTLMVCVCALGGCVEPTDKREYEEGTATFSFLRAMLRFAK